MMIQLLANIERCQLKSLSKPLLSQEVIMDRSWIELSGSDRFCKEYSDGVKSFIQFAVNSADSRNWILCPCPVCNNVYLHSISVVEDHLFRMASYQTTVERSQISNPDSSSNDLVSADTPGAIITKNVRGVSRSLALKKIIRKNGGNKLPITYPEGKLKPVGMWASIFTYELGILCRKGKYLEAKTWGAVPLSEKEKLYVAIKNSFEIEFSLNVLTGMESQLEILYKQWMYRMHKHYAKYPSMEVAIENPYGGVAKEHWENLCKDHFATEAFKKKSRTNQANRSKRKIHGLLGSRSYVNHQYMMRNKETNEELGPIEFWKEVHFDKGTEKWKCQRAKDLYDEMTQLQQMSPEEEGTPLTEKEIVERVLRNESGYMLGIGYGEMQHASSKSRKDYAAEYGRAQSRAEEAERRAEATERRAEAAERRVDHLGSELANVKETMEQFRSFMENIGSGLQLSPNRFQSDSPRTPRSTRRGRY